MKWEFVGSEDSFNRLANLIDSNKIKINFAGSIDKLLVDSKKVKNIIIEKLSDSSLKHQEKIINLYFRGENILSIIDWSEIILQRIPFNFLSSGELLNLFTNITRARSFQIRLKRVSDILLSLLILLFSMPLMLFFGIIIFLEDKGPILYFQNRVGKNGLKF